MPNRHFDFNKIYTEFQNYYKNPQKAKDEYYQWINDMNLDETLEYSQARESFRWAQDMLQILREDKDNKYYRILVGLPLRSMNGNAYRERDLIAGALTLKGKHPSLNHKDEFWFSPDNPRNRWGNITVVDAKYEDGAVEALLQVPKTTICPICKGRPMTELIDEKRILNVSLEGDCSKGKCYDGTCEGFYFTDPPFTLLTTEVVLPGIPLARIKPMEAYLPFSHSSNNQWRKTNMTSKKKVKPKIIEDTVDTATLVQPPVNVNTKSFSDPNFKGTFGTPISTDTALHSETQSSGNVTVPVGTSPGNYQMKSGTALTHTKPTVPTESVKEPFSDYTDFDDCVSKNSDKEDPAAYCKSIQQQTEPQEQAEPEFADQQGPYAPTDGPADDVKMPKPEDIRTGPSKTKPPEDSDTEMPEGAPAVLPAKIIPDVDVGETPPKATAATPVGDAPVEQAEDPRPCPDGQHRDENGNCVADATVEQDEPCPEGEHRDPEGHCVPDTPSEQETPTPPCPDGWHEVDGDCVKDAPVESLPTLEAQREAIHANLTAASMKEKALTWEKKYSEIYGKLTKLSGHAEGLSRAFDKVAQQARNAEVDRERATQKFNEQCGLVTDLKHQLDDTRKELDLTSRKYNTAMTTNLELSKKLTRANEDYLEIAKAKEHAEEKLTRARTNAKKTLKLKV
jgi:hypothetical protein